MMRILPQYKGRTPKIVIISLFSTAQSQKTSVLSFARSSVVLSIYEGKYCYNERFCRISKKMAIKIL